MKYVDLMKNIVKVKQQKETNSLPITYTHKNN